MRKLTGINIQYPISRLILSKAKKIETREYSLAKQYIGKKMYLVETPGKTGRFKARIVAIIVFGAPFKYASKKEFYADAERHFVHPASPYRWKAKFKWGWPIVSMRKLAKPLKPNKRLGIVYTRDLEPS